jgi:hypothetical protein
MIDSSSGENEQFRARFRFRLQKRLDLKVAEHAFSVGGREVLLKSQDRDGLISESNWLVMSCGGFESENAARLFAKKLKNASDFSAVASRLGIDSGLDLRTGGFSTSIKEKIASATGFILRDNVHGVDVFPDDPQIVFLNVNITATVSASPAKFLAGINEFFVEPEALSQRARDIIVLLNYALMRPDPIAQIVFATSAVEMLGQQENWSLDQRRLLDELATAATNSTTGTAEERTEVVESIKRSLHKVGLRQGVMRLLAQHDLSSLKKRWDELYGRRSTLVHGLAPKPGVDYVPLAHETVSLCGCILLKILKDEAPAAVAHVDELYDTRPIQG